MSAFGSVFLGDVARSRILSTSTPPSSPPPHLSSQSIDDLIDDAERQAQAESLSRSSSQSPNHPLFNRKPFSPPPINVPPTIPPEVSLDLRIRWLETLVFGTKGDVKEKVLVGMGLKGDSVATMKSLIRNVEDIQRRLDSVVGGNEGLKRFLDQYEQHAHLLTPSFALSSSLPPLTSPPYDSLSSSELEGLLSEMESDIRSADKDLREIELLERKNVTSAGKLGSYEALEPRLNTLLELHQEDAKSAKELEKRVGKLVDRYATNVDILSELFVAWDDTIQEAEDRVARMERDQEERRRLGYK